MAFSLYKILKGLLVREEGTLTPKEMEIIPGGSASTKTTITSSQTANRTLTLPDATDTLVGKATTDTLTNKTFDADGTGNVLSNVDDGNIKTGANIARNKLASGTADRVLVNDGSGVLSDSTVTTNDLNTLSGLAGETIVTTDNTQTLSNKTLDNSNIATLQDVNLTIQDNSDNTKQLKFEASAITTGTTRTLTAPDANTTILGTDATQTVSNKTLNNTNTITVQDSNFTLQDNSDNTKQLQLQLSGLTTATTRTLTAPDANTTILGTDSAQVITNKDIDGGSATNSRRITVPKDTKANLDALTRKEGTVVYATDTKKFYVDNGTSLDQTGGVELKEFTLVNNQSSAANVTGFLVDQVDHKMFKTDYSIARRMGSLGTVTEDTAFYTNLGTGFNGTVYDIRQDNNGKLLVGGIFDELNSITRNRFLRLNSDGTVDTAFYTNLGSNLNAAVQFIQLQTDNKIVLAGDFTTFNGNTRNKLLRLNSDGTEDTSFYTNLGTGFDDVVNAIGIQSDGKIVAGGGFLNLNGNARNFLVRINSDGTEDTSFYTNLGTAFNNTVTGVTVQADGKILVSGVFTSFNGNTRNRLVRLNSDGTEDTTFYTNLGSAFDNGVWKTVELSDNTIIAYGYFTTFNGNSINRMVKLNSDGTEVTSFRTNLGTAFNATVFRVIQEVTGKLLVGGVFTSFNGNTRNHILRLNLDGTEDTTFYSDIGTGTVGDVWVVFAQSDYKLLVGGGFISFNGNTRNDLVRLSQASVLGTELMEVGSFNGIYRPSSTSWSLVNETFSGDDSGTTFSINTSGQLRYTTSNLTGVVLESKLKYILYLM